MDIGFISLGCSKNLVDTEIMIGLLKQAGHHVVDRLEHAETIIINTCGFLTSAQEESINNIISVGQLKQAGTLKYLIATGCLAQRFEHELLEELPELDAIAGVSTYLDIVDIVDRVAVGERVHHVKPPGKTYIEKGPRVLTTSPGMAYLKIAEGCNSFCSYCAIPLIRGHLRSRPLSELVDEGKLLVEHQGIKELVLIAQDTAAYGKDLHAAYGLPQLLDKLSEIVDLAWLRLLYLHPDSFDSELIATVKDNPKILPYLDIPIQHISDNILKNMRRRETGDSIRRLLYRLREEIPGLILRTTIMTGFPGETEADFEELSTFVQDMEFDWLGAFAFEPQEGTPAYHLDHQVPTSIAEERRDHILNLQKGITRKKNIEHVGSHTQVLISREVSTNIYVGRTAFQAPDVDGLTIVKSKTPLTPGTLVNVRLKSVRNYDMIGETYL